MLTADEINLVNEKIIKIRKRMDEAKDRFVYKNTHTIFGSMNDHINTILYAVERIKDMIARGSDIVDVYEKINNIEKYEVLVTNSVIYEYTTSHELKDIKNVIC